MSEDVIGLDGGCDARHRGEPPEPGAERGEVRERASERAEQREVDGIEPDKGSEQQNVTRRDRFPVQESPSIAEPRFQAAQRVEQRRLTGSSFFCVHPLGLSKLG